MYVLRISDNGIWLPKCAKLNKDNFGRKPDLLIHTKGCQLFNM